MRRTSILSGAGVALLSTPALAHVGDHGEHSALHFFADHGIAAGVIALAIVAGTIYLIKRKG